MNLSVIIERTVFWWRTRRQAREIDIALQLRRRTRPKRQRAARNTTATPSMIAGWLPGASVAKISQIVADVRGGR